MFVKKFDLCLSFCGLAYYSAERIEL